jgi:hypothetical protein
MVQAVAAHDREGLERSCRSRGADAVRAPKQVTSTGGRDGRPFHFPR